MRKIIMSSFIFALLFGSCDLPKENQSLIDTGFNHKDSAQLDSTEKNPAKADVAKIDTIHYGIDISHFQGDVLKLLDVKKDSLQFVICKATEGLSFTDPDFNQNWQMAKSKGLIRGAYHFYVCSDDPIKQADFFSKQIQGIEKTDIAPILDIEQGSMSSSVSAEQMQKNILSFLKRVEKNTGRKPILYTDFSFGQENFTSPEVANYQLWIADYGKGDWPRIPELWKDKGFLIWQRSSSYEVDSHQTDYDVMYGSINDLIN